ncbi:2-isopropylmalate synthase [Blastopirellula retiformator]|uniref:2-isopropylmalate synthase n=1 Tax=Blastopirellula retiformator TaxID=2527970 RepID=A0A5C5VMH8_9BACT|nr:2-isopropylmalate synthase [Blastopirellula retiformator]TWT39738.1 2-isopropylmalate synthase [Blastopirellula retiformator]
MSNERTIKIFDTTLRDGEQSPGASMNLPEKMEIAQALVDLGVDIIEAGFPIASPGDFEAVHEIASNIRGATICGLARCNERDIDRAWEALKTAKSPRIHVFLATSAIHREFKLKMTPDEIAARAIEGVSRAASYCDDVEFSPEDAARTEPDFLCRVVEEAIKAGATTVNIPDTVGYATPTHMGRVISDLVNRVPNIGDAVIAVHCHNDLGLAVANSLAAVEAGAGQIECTINGIGERAGNCALEEIVMAMRTRHDYYKVDTRINTERLVPTSRLVSSVTGMQVQRNKAIVGRNAFAHESGIHQDGMLKEPTTYEIMRPEDVGFAKTDLVLGKHSGRAALADRAKGLGYHLSGEQLQVVFEKFKELADKKKDIYDGDISALCEQQIRGSDLTKEWSLVSLEVSSGTKRQPNVKMTLKHAGEEHSAEVAEGDGPIDAAFWAVERITGVKLNCKDFQVRSATLGRDAQGTVTVDIEHEGSIFRGRGVSTDTVESTVLAILDAVNRICWKAAKPAAAT